MEDEAWRELGHVEALVMAAGDAALAGMTSATPPPKPSPSRGKAVDLTILLTDDIAVQDLNARFRGKDAATNVLSFPALPTAAPHLGDIALAHGVCAAEAVAQGKPLADHLSHLVVHGVLHLLGYDHQAEASAETMEAMERDILSTLGIPDPYRQDHVHVGP